MNPAIDRPQTVAIVEHATCLGCGCACDDIDLIIEGDLIVEARNACPRGIAWFGDGSAPAKARVDSRDVEMDEALDEAARLLSAAHRPLVYLAPELSCGAQREGVAVADLLHAALDSVTSATAMSAILAAQERGRAGATLGEIRNRADVLVFWGVDPALESPRFWSRYAPLPEGVHVPGGRTSRTVIAIDVGDRKGPDDADVRVAVSPGDEVAVLTLLAGGEAGIRTGAASAVDERSTGIGRAVGTVLPLLLGGRYVALVADAEDQARDIEVATALISLVQSLNVSTRAALTFIRAGGNRSGADAVMTSQTGYPAAVDLAYGYPRYRPYDGTAAARLTRGDVDAVLVIGSAAHVPHDIRSSMMALPSVILGPRASEMGGTPRVLIDTGVAGIHDAGVALRMDDVPVPLRSSVAGPPTAQDVVQALRLRLGTRR